MAHSPFEGGLAGIRGAMAFSPATAKPLNALAKVLLRDDLITVSPDECELLGAYVSSLNDCFFYRNIH